MCGNGIDLGMDHWFFHDVIKRSGDFRGKVFGGPCRLTKWIVTLWGLTKRLIRDPRNQLGKLLGRLLLASEAASSLHAGGRVCWGSRKSAPLAPC